jgi:hypothetical protein
MRRHSNVGRVNSRPVADRSKNRHRRTPLMVTTKHPLLSSRWKANVEASEATVRRFTAEPPPTNLCHVVLFGIGGGDLHINVTHSYRTLPVRGWAGPAKLAQGFVHNRIFSDTPPRRIVRHIRDMVFAAQDVSAAHNLR